MNITVQTPGIPADPGRHLITTNTRPDTVFVQGRGSWLSDEAGKRHLDLVQGWAVNSLGHAPAALVEALAAQAAQLLSTSPAFHNRAALRLAQRLLRRALDGVFNSGTRQAQGTAAAPGRPLRQKAFARRGTKPGPC